MEMIEVRGGTFQMGSDSGNVDEKPVHQVTVPDFFLGKYPVTQGLWLEVMGNNPSRFKGDDLPVERVSWNDVQEFLRKLNAKTGMQYRLPSETEWEYAAGGGAEQRTKWAGTNEEKLLGEYAWYDKNSGGQTHPVGQKKPNRLGLYDMSGNVWEWCEDDWHGDYDGAPSDGSAWVEPGNRGLNRVFRGGCWFNCQITYRNWGYPAGRVSNLGFRLAVSA